MEDTSSSLSNSCSADKFVIEGEEQDVRKRYENLSSEALRDDIAKKQSSSGRTGRHREGNYCRQQRRSQSGSRCSGELNKIVSPVDLILRKLAERQVKLQNALLRSQEFQVSFDEFMAKLDTFEDELAKQDPISALHETVQVQRQENEALQKELALQDPVSEKLVQNGQGVVDALEDAPERKFMEKKMEELKSRWQSLKGKVDERQNKLVKVEPEAQKIPSGCRFLGYAASRCRKQVDEFEPLTVDIDNIAKQKELVKQIQGMADKLKSDVQEVGGSADELKEQAEKDVPVLEAEVEDYVARIEKLSSIPSELSSVLDDHAPEVQNVGHKGKTLLQQVHDSSPDHAVVTSKVAHVSQKFGELQQKLKAQEEALTSKIRDTDNFNAKVEELDGCIQDTREKLAAVGPVSTDPTAVEKQLELVQHGLESETGGEKPTLEDAQGLCEKLTDQNKDEPLIVAAIKDKLDKVESPFEDLKAKLADLEGRLQAAQIRSQEFNVSFSVFKDKLQDLEELSTT
ncbi:microtubule-actin cross-linking factor 1-like [Pocillopora verrucosa]|uniref:microtubule-actin cross-linking factor 1-like n=1 Tax=Pocillopora verrucosa TaxID=203993 RepID=UPI00333F73F7